MPIWLQIISFPIMGVFLGIIFAVIPFFCTGLQAQGMNKLGWEEKIGYGLSALLFIGGFVAAWFIVTGRAS